jgi:hypothetical protein
MPPLGSALEKTPLQGFAEAPSRSGLQAHLRQERSLPLPAGSGERIFGTDANVIWVAHCWGVSDAAIRADVREVVDQACAVEVGAERVAAATNA